MNLNTVATFFGRLVALGVVLLLSCWSVFAPVGADGAQAHHTGSTEAYAKRVKRFTHSKVTKTFEEGLGTVTTPGFAAEIATLVSSEPASPLSPTESAALSIPGLLQGSGAQHAFATLESGGRPSKAELGELVKVLGKLYRNPAIRDLSRRGQMLERSPAKLHRLIAELAGKLRSGHSGDATGGDPFTQAQQALWGSSSKEASMATSTAELLSAPGAQAYLASLPPLTLALLEQVDLPTAGTGARASSVAEGAADDRCSDSEWQVFKDAAVAAAVSTSQSIPDARDKVAVLAVLRGLRHILPSSVYAIAKVELLEGNPITAVLKDVGLVALQYGGVAGLRAIRDAAIDCEASRISLIHEQETIKAGHWQPYKLAIYDEHGRRILQAAIDDPDSLTIAHLDPNTDHAHCDKRLQWECYGDKAGVHEVRATLRGLSTFGALTVEPGPPKTMKVVPESASIGIGEESPRYKAIGEDEFHNVIDLILPGHATSDGVLAHLRMFPADGPCSDVTDTCTPGATGPHDIIITRDDGLQEHTTLEVLPDKLELSPETASIDLGESQGYTAEEVSSATAKDLGPATIGVGEGQVHLSIAPDGSCDQAAGTCTPATPGPHTVSARSPAAGGEATLTAEGPPDPEWAGTVTMSQGGSYTYGSESITESDSMSFTVTEGAPPEAVYYEPPGEPGFWATRIGFSGTASDHGEYRESLSGCTSSSTWDGSGPFFPSPYGSGSVLYLDVAPAGYRLISGVEVSQSDDDCQAGSGTEETVRRATCWMAWVPHTLSVQGGSLNDSSDCPYNVFLTPEPIAHTVVALTATCPGGGSVDAEWECGYANADTERPDR